MFSTMDNEHPRDPLTSRSLPDRLRATHRAYNRGRYYDYSRTIPNVKKTIFAEERGDGRDITIFALPPLNERTLYFKTDSKLVFLLNGQKKVLLPFPEVEELLRFVDHNGFWLLFQHEICVEGTPELSATTDHSSGMLTKRMFDHIGNVLVLEKRNPKASPESKKNDMRSQTLPPTNGNRSYPKDKGGVPQEKTVDSEVEKDTIIIDEKLFKDKFHSLVRRLVVPRLDLKPKKDKTKNKNSSDQNMSSKLEQNMSSKLEQNMSSKLDKNKSSKPDQNKSSKPDQNMSSKPDQNKSSKPDQKMGNGNKGNVDKQNKVKSDQSGKGKQGSYFVWETIGKISGKSSRDPATKPSGLTPGEPSVMSGSSSGEASGKIPESTWNTNCLRCSILIDGDSDSLSVMERTLQNNIPVIVIKNSKGLADMFVSIQKGLKEKTDKGPLWAKAEAVYARYKNLIFYLDKSDLIDKDKIANVVLNALADAYVKEIGKTSGTVKYRPEHVQYILNCIQLKQKLEDSKLQELLKILFEENDGEGTEKSQKQMKEDRQVIIEEAVNLNRCHLLQYLDEHYDDPILNLRLDKLHFGSSNGKQTETLTDKDIFQMAIREGQKDLAHLIWRKVKHPIGAALYAFKKLRKYCKKSEDDDAKFKKYESMKNDFQVCATCTLNLNHKRDEGMTTGLLVGDLGTGKGGGKMKSDIDPKIGEDSQVKETRNGCLRLAITSKNIHFLSQPPCIDFRNKLWYLKSPFNLKDLLKTKEQTNDAKVKGNKVEDKGHATERTIEHTEKEPPNAQNKKEAELSKCSVCFFDKMLSPYYLMCYNLFGLILFLIAYAIMLISVLTVKTFHWLEIIVWVMFIPFPCEIVNQIVRNKLVVKRKKKNKFLVLAVLAHSLFLLAVCIRVVAYFYTDSPEWMVWARILFSVDYICFSFLLLEFCYASKFLGPLLVMIKKMVYLFFRFAVIVLIIFLAYAVASESVLYPETQLNAKLPFYLLHKPFFAMFAEFNLDDFEAEETEPDNPCTTVASRYNEYTDLRCPSYSGRFYVPILLGWFYIAVGVVLLNLLIALFGYEIKKLEEKTTQLWHLQNTYFAIKYYCHVCPPFPFTFLVFPLAWLQKLRHDVRPDYLVFEVLSEHERIYLSNIEEESRKTYIDSINKNNSLHIHCVVKCPHTESSITHNQKLPLPKNSDELTEEAAVAVLTKPPPETDDHQPYDQFGPKENDFLQSEFRMKKMKKKRRYFSVRSKYKYGIRWQVIKVKPVPPKIELDEDNFKAQASYVRHQYD